MSSNGTFCRSQEQIETICYEFYLVLYVGRHHNSSITEAQDEIFGQTLPKLTPVMQRELNKPITLEELTQVKEMGKQKATKLDGIVTKFFQYLWLTIGEDF